MPDSSDRRRDEIDVGRLARSSRGRPASRSRGLAASWPRLGRRGLVVSLGVFAIAGPALAVVQPWSPVLSREGIDGPVSTDSTPVVAEARDALAVLRRPQSDEDRKTAGPLVAAVGMGNQIDGVQTDSIRALAAGWALVPAKRVKTGPAETSDDELCITDGQAIGCSPASAVREHGVGVRLATTTHTSLSGVVPDAVARVRFIPAEGTATEVPAESNFYSLSVPKTAPSPPVSAPAGYDGPSVIPGPPMPVGGTIQWLDRQGRVIGPTRPTFR
jgi:hypothetical protein